MLDVAAVRSELTKEMDQLQLEIDKLIQAFQQPPEYFGNKSNFPYAHWGYLMNIFARVDLLSRYWRGKGGRGFQTTRMVEFLDHYVHPGQLDASKVAVQLWRHTLMHTGQGRFLREGTSGDIYTWQIAFPPRSGWNHYTLWRHPHDNRMVLTLIIEDLARELGAGQAAYLDDLVSDKNLQAMYLAEDRGIREQAFTL